MSVLKSKGLKNRCSNVRGRGRWSLVKKRESIHPPFAFLLHSGLQWVGDFHPQWRGWSLLSLSDQMAISSRNALRNTSRTNAYQLPGHLLGESSSHINLTITLLDENPSETL